MKQAISNKIKNTFLNGEFHLTLNNKIKHK